MCLAGKNKFVGLNGLRKALWGPPEICEGLVFKPFISCCLPATTSHRGTILGVQALRALLALSGQESSRILVVGAAKIGNLGCLAAFPSPISQESPVGFRPNAQSLFVVYYLGYSLLFRIEFIP